MTRIAIVEDRDKDRHFLHGHLQQYEREHNIDAAIEMFLDGEDISMDYACQFDIIFTTATDYAVKGYQVAAFDYLDTAHVLEQRHVDLLPCAVHIIGHHPGFFRSS